MEVIIRNITKDKEETLDLPMNILKLEEILGNDEFIIVDAEKVIPVSTYDSIIEINTFLENCMENDVYEDDLAVLAKAGYTFDEIRNMVEDGSYIIIDFTNETAGWPSADIFSDYDKGLCLQTSGYAELPFKYDDSMEDYISWEKVWFDADGNGWRTARHDYHDYIVHA